MTTPHFLSTRPANSSVRARAALYGAEVFSGAGDGIFWVALVVELSGHPRFGLLVLLAVLARLGPRALLSVPSGRLLDRGRLRSLLVTIDIVRGGLMLTVATVGSVSDSPSWLLLFVLVSYIVGVPTRPGLMVALVRVTDETGLAAANATISTLRQVMTFVGPLLGAVVATQSTSAAFAINGASFLVAATLVALTPAIDAGRAARPSRREHDDEPDHGSTREVGRRSIVREVDGLAGVFALVVGMYVVRGFEMVVHVLVVRDLLDAEPGAIGYLAGAIGLGAIVVMPLAARVSSASPDRIMQLAVVMTAVPTAALAVGGDVTVAMAILLFVGAGMVLFEVISVVTIQRSVPAEHLGRVFGALNAASNAGKLIGAVAAPLVVAGLGTRSALVAAASSLAVTGAATAPALNAVARNASQRRAALQPISDVLGTFGIFGAASTATLERLAGAVTPVECEPGTVLIREGDQPDHLYLAISGEFDVTVRGAVTNRLRAGDWFGEIGLVRRIPRTATVTVAAPATVWRIPGEVFIAAIEESGAAPSALVQGIADRIARSSA